MLKKRLSMQLRVNSLINHVFGFPFRIPLRGIARICVELRRILGASNWAQVKSTYLGNPKCVLSMIHNTISTSSSNFRSKQKILFCNLIKISPDLVFPHVSNLLFSLYCNFCKLSKMVRKRKNRRYRNLKVQILRAILKLHSRKLLKFNLQSISNKFWFNN